MAAAISQAAVDLIVACEVSSKALYEKKYRHPEWPGEASGVTIGIGYDVGYATVAKLVADWKAMIPDTMINMLSVCCGVHGAPAAELTARVRDKIDVPWAAAMEVFMRRDLPKWTAKVCEEIAGAQRLHPDCLGALVSLAYNRGSFLADGDRRSEMRAIRTMIIKGQLDAVGDQFRAMKRLWPASRGLRERRDAEAAMWERGLKQPIPLQPIPPVKRDNPPPLVPAPKPGKAEGGTVGGSIVATGAGASHAAQNGASPRTIVLIIVAGVLAAVAVAVGIYLWRARPVIARAKG